MTKVIKTKFKKSDDQTTLTNIEQLQTLQNIILYQNETSREWSYQNSWWQDNHIKMYVKQHVEKVNHIGTVSGSIIMSLKLIGQF